MKKSLDFDFIGLYEALLADVSSYFPTDRVEWGRDLSRLTRLSSSRGLPTFTIDLPALGKILDQSLSRGRLEWKGENCSGSRHSGSRIPRLFWGLWIRLFDDDGHLRADIDPNVIFFLRTLLYAGKNLKMDCPRKHLFSTIEEFYDVDEELPPPSQIWEEDGCDINPDNLGHLRDFDSRVGIFGDLSSDRRPGRQALLLDAIQYTADCIIGSLPDFDPEELRFKHGPGAVSDLSGGGYKYSFPAWGQRLETLFPYTGYGTTPSEWIIGDEGLSSDIKFTELASKLCAVPKTQKGPRLIAAEPTCHQWIQQGIRDFLYSTIRQSSTPLRHCLDFSNQTPSRQMALKASRYGNLATVDLKSASDRLGCALVQRVFRRNLPLLGSMISSRTRFIVNKIGGRRTGLHKLRKFSTQGSALTFPVQSIVFSIICIGVGRFIHPNQSFEALARQVRVYGDDIIVPVLWEPQIEEILHLLGLRVNTTKTHVEGFFRESCGMDAYGGYDVTPAYIRCAVDRSKPETVASSVAVANNFFLKGLWHAAKFLDTTTMMRDMLIIGPRSGLFGLKSFSGPTVTSRNRWNPKYQRWEVRALTVIAKSGTIKQDTAACLLQFFTERGYLLSKDNAGTPNGKLWSLLNPLMDYESGVAVAGVPVIRHTWVPCSELS
jgi:hypothetical protein